MDRRASDGNKEPRIDVRTLPGSVAELWETMLRLDPKWDLAKWLDERATEELDLVGKHLGREQLRLEQRLYRIDSLVRRLKRKREAAQGSFWTDPHQRNLFDVYESSDESNTEESSASEEVLPLVDLGALGSDDDPLLVIISEHIMNTIDDVGVNGRGVNFETIAAVLEPLGIRTEEIDEALSWLLQRRMVIELDQDVYGIDG
tara:strand:- start:1379 stop:1987 length:609 start_codon:yes stop_codon:yes gene_type:complete